MQNIHNIYEYDDNTLEMILQKVLPLYELWLIKPLENEKMIFMSGKRSDVKLFTDFIAEHVEKEFPHPLMIVFGMAEKGNKDVMIRTNRKYIKLQFEKFAGDENGEPFVLSGAAYNNQMQPVGYMAGQQGYMNGQGGVTIHEIQGIIDRNVNDAQRSIRAEYEELNAKREAESIKRIAELEMRMEMYKLEMRENDLREKERKLREEMEDFEDKRSEGLGNVKDYSRAIAGGILELGKAYFGIDKDEIKLTKKKKGLGEVEEKAETRKASFNDDDFEQVDAEREYNGQENQRNDDQVSEMLTNFSGLTEDQKYEFLQNIFPGEDDPQQEESTTEETTENNEVEPENNNENEDVSADNNN